MEWLSKIDPNVILLALGAIAGLFTAAKNNATKMNIKDALTSALAQELTKLLQSGASEALARQALEAAAASLLERMGVKRSKAVDLVVHVCVEAALAELHAELADAVNKIPDELAAAAAAAAKVDAAFTPKGDFPQLGLPVEEVPLEPSPGVITVHGDDSAPVSKLDKP